MKCLFHVAMEDADSLEINLWEESFLDGCCALELNIR